MQIKGVYGNGSSHGILAGMGIRFEQGWECDWEHNNMGVGTINACRHSCY